MSTAVMTIFTLNNNSDTTDPKNTNYMALAVKAFFDNGGSQLYVSRVFAPGSDTGIATSGVPSSSNVVVSARFPGMSGNSPVNGGNQNVTVKLKATRTQNLSSLPPGSLVASAANTSSLANAPSNRPTRSITLNRATALGRSCECVDRHRNDDSDTASTRPART